jgi:2-polyprenyl-3-methyl-5-hydroxy-6-metoxy-1,4-benzoquinol methylase
MSSNLISASYRKLNEELHNGARPYGSGGWKHIYKVADVFKEGTVLDYGCGKATFSKKFGRPVTNYDPCIPQHSKHPEPHDYVYCTDVLEHVETDLVDNVLDDLRALTKKKAYVLICLQPSVKLLPDGSDPHKTVKPPEWWMERLEKRFAVTVDQLDKMWLGAYLT